MKKKCKKRADVTGVFIDPEKIQPEPSGGWNGQKPFRLDAIAVIVPKEIWVFESDFSAN